MKTPNNIYLLKALPCSSIEEFISYWKKFYHYPDNENRYYKNIIVKQFDENNLKELFHWKNGMTLSGSGKKEQSLNTKIIQKLDKINEYKLQSNIEIDSFNEDFGNISAVWRIFLLHIIKPKSYPIYDQHTHRAYNFIIGEEWRSIKNTISDNNKLKFYFDAYLPFVKESGCSNMKELDEAFFAFGQFLNINKQGDLFV